MRAQRSTFLLPDATASFEEWHRAWHRDLPTLDVEQLLAELAVVREAWARRVYYGRYRPEAVIRGADWVHAREWLRERGERIRTELARRRRR